MARDKGVNQDQDNPLRLLAVSQGHTHYFTGVPCYRGHIAKQYAKTGRCTRCAREDERTFKRTPRGKDFQRRKDDLRYIRSGGKPRKPRREWYVKLELYNQLVAAGLPVDPSLRLQRRVRLAWDAYQNLTSDDSPSSRATRKLMKRAVKIARKQQATLAATRKRQEREAEREARRVERIANDAKLAPMRAERRRIAALIAQGKVMGLSINTMRARVYHHGWTWERACSTPADPSSRPNGLAAAARAAGLRVALVESRICTLGWSREKALTTPVGGAQAKARRDERRKQKALTPVLLCDNGMNREDEKGFVMPKGKRRAILRDVHVGMLMGSRGRPPNLRRNEARDAGLKTYDDPDQPCWCGSETKYTKNAACVECLIEKGKTRYADLQGAALEKRKREDHARYVARIARDK